MAVLWCSLVCKPFLLRSTVLVLWLINISGMNCPECLFYRKHQLLRHLMSTFLFPFLPVLPNTTSPISDIPLNPESPRLSVSWALFLCLGCYLGCVNMDRSGTRHGLLFRCCAGDADTHGSTMKMCPDSQLLLLFLWSMFLCKRTLQHFSGRQICLMGNPHCSSLIH